MTSQEEEEEEVFTTKIQHTCPPDDALASARRPAPLNHKAASCAQKDVVFTPVARSWRHTSLLAE